MTWRARRRGCYHAREGNAGAPSPPRSKATPATDSLSPVAALRREEAGAFLQKLDAFEGSVGGLLTSEGTDARYRSRTHVLLSWVHSPVAIPRSWTPSRTYRPGHPRLHLDVVHQGAGERGDRRLASGRDVLRAAPVRARDRLARLDRRDGGERLHGVPAREPPRRSAPASRGCRGRQREPRRSGDVGEVDDTPAVHAPLRAGEFSCATRSACIAEAEPVARTPHRPGDQLRPAVRTTPGVKHKTPAMLVRGMTRTATSTSSPLQKPTRTSRPAQPTLAPTKATAPPTPNKSPSSAQTAERLHEWPRRPLRILALKVAGNARVEVGVVAPLWPGATGTRLKLRNARRDRLPKTREDSSTNGRVAQGVAPPEQRWDRRGSKSRDASG